MYTDQRITGPGPAESWVTARQFITTLDRALNDQSYSSTDATAYNPPGQFQVVGPYSTSTEGRVQSTPNGEIGGLPPIVLVAAGLAALYLLTRKG